MRVTRVLSVAQVDPEEKSIDLTRHLSGDERVSMLEELRRGIPKVTQHEYPQRLRRVLEVAHRTGG